MILNTNSSSSGQSLVEVVVTTAIAMLILVALVGGATVAVRNIQYSRTRARAMELNRQATEWLRSERAKGWSGFCDKFESSTYCLNNFNFDNPGSCGAGELVDNAFEREASFTKERNPSNPEVIDKVTVTLTTSWTDSQGEHREEVVTYLTRW
jgi:type II secretory pathway pseudopilin PulG